ncbi:MAG TPA: Nramp family divalent metal transporter [Planctomycetaceae bacterium]|jgi:manganese transport protein|nr:Nramp family divalent metal transporter [Planctomycetaceae bacterium]
MDDPLLPHSALPEHNAPASEDTPGNEIARQTVIPPARNMAGAYPPRSRSLDDVHNSISVSYPGFAKRLFAFLGPAYLISVGYMDPGNWATDIEGGARFGYELVWILLMSNAMAVLLQTLSARLGIVSGRDLAQACGESYSRPLAFSLWILCEIAVAACDLAEVIGTVIGLNLLFGVPPLYGLIITAFDTFVFLAIQRLGIRKTEAFIVMLVGTIGVCFLIELALAQPEWKAVFSGFLPYLQSSPPFLFSKPQALYVAIGILGATVMPHNLYLHSALVQTRRIAPTREGFLQACRYNLIDSVVALNLAFLVNAAILITAAAAFYNHPNTPSGEIQLQDAHELLYRVLGTRLAPVAFAVGLLAAGQSSTMTGTLAGQVVMEGFVNLRMRPWTRRLVTRLLAIVPAVITVVVLGADQMTNLLVLSQVVLSLQLPFAIVPLLHFTADRARMGEFANPRWVQILGWIATAIIIGLNAQLLASTIGGWITSAGSRGIWIEIAVVPLTVAFGLLLLWLVVRPWVIGQHLAQTAESAGRTTARDVAARISEPIYRRIGVALDHSPTDNVALEHAAALARLHHSELILIHVVEGVGGQLHGSESRDQERQGDQAYLEQLARALRQTGAAARGVLRFGNPARELSRAVADEQIDLLVLGSHGHGKIGDWLFGETAGTVRHAVKIPVLAVRGASRLDNTGGPAGSSS